MRAERRCSRRCRVARALIAIGAALVALGLISCGAIFTSGPPLTGPAPIHTLGSYYFLPKTRIKIDGVPGKDNSYAVTIAQVNEPDRDHRYFLSYHPNGFAEDIYTVTVDSKGLLQTLNLQAEDKTPAIINKLADTAVSVLSAAENAAGLVRKQAGTPTPNPCDPPPQLAFSVAFDPQDYDEYWRAKKLLGKAKFELTVCPEPRTSKPNECSTSDAKQVVQGARPASESEQHSLSSNGVFFHPPTTITITVKPLDYECLRLVQTTDVRIPDRHEVAVFDLTRLALVKRTTNLAFVDGNLTTVNETRPSQVLAGVTIPADLAAKVAAAIPALIKIQNDTANAEINARTAQLNAQTAQLTAESNRLKAEAALAQQRGGDSSSSVSRALLHHAEAENAKAQTELLNAEERRARSAGSSNPTATVTPTPSPP